MQDLFLMRYNMRVGCLLFLLVVNIVDVEDVDMYLLDGMEQS